VGKNRDAASVRRGEQHDHNAVDVLDGRDQVAGLDRPRCGHVASLVECLHVAEVDGDSEVRFHADGVSVRAALVEIADRDVSGHERSLPAVLVLAFVIAAAFEVGGLALVVRDLRRERSAALRLIEGPVEEPVELNEKNIREFPGSLETRRRLLQSERDSAAAGELVRAVLIDLLRPDRRRLIGPGLVAIGIVIGTAANIWAIGC
jgi:hypothetical protein